MQECIEVLEQAQIQSWVRDEVDVALLLQIFIVVSIRQTLQEM